jgi:GH15 family glucan-1,4-alpha-glucosidase
MDSSASYRDIGGYGVVGNPRTAALVGRGGSIDWCCLPYFHSGGVFAALLDEGEGGRFAVTLADGTPDRQYYEPRTNVLRTVLDGPSGRVELLDFMPYFHDRGELAVRDEIHRRVRCVDGEPTVRVDFDPRFDFGRSETTVEARDDGWYATGGEHAMALATDASFERPAGEPTGRRTLDAGEEVWLSCRFGRPSAALFEPAEPPETSLERTRAYWKRWASRSSYDGRWEGAVLRSALALKLLVNESTGAVVAAATSSLPEVSGGTRNWDYRYAWIRDSVFSAWSFHRLDYQETGIDFLNLLERSLDPGHIPPIVDVHGDDVPDEEHLDHFEGYRGAEPVRMGNDAAGQRQWGSYGSAIDGLYFSHRTLGGVGAESYESFVRPTVEYVSEAWEEPDSGIWEVRGGPRQFVTSKMWCWVVLDRGVRMARSLGYRDDVGRWSPIREEIRAELVERGWSEERDAFTIAYEDDALDASVLLMPLVGFLPADHPKMERTIDTVVDELGHGPLVYRYRPEAVESDPIEADDSAFTTCSFWLVPCLAHMGRMEEARRLFEELLDYSNHLGLYAEEIDLPSGTQLGNFPQAYVHMGLINAATELDQALD